jgi:hypothetical protein
MKIARRQRGSRTAMTPDRTAQPHPAPDPIRAPAPPRRQEVPGQARDATA